MQLLPWMHAQKNWQFSEFWSKMKHTHTKFIKIYWIIVCCCALLVLFSVIALQDIQSEESCHTDGVLGNLVWELGMLSWLLIFTLPNNYCWGNGNVLSAVGATAHPPPPKSPPSGISGLSFDFSFLSSLLFFCLLFVLSLSCHISASGPFSWLFSQKIVSHFSLK